MKKDIFGNDINPQEEFIEEWQNKGYIIATKTEKYKEIINKIDVLREEVFNCVSPNENSKVRRLLQKIDEMQNARSSIEFDETLKLLYKRYKKTRQ